MSLALHQLRHEFRRSRVFVAVYLVILLGNYAVAAGWIGQPEYNPDYQGWGNENVLPGLLGMAFWISIALLIMGTITADSPVNRERFLASRPFPIRSLVIAKTLFITLALLLPAAVVELLSLLAINAPGKFIALGTIEHFLLLGIFATFVALFAAHWKSAFTAKLGLAATIGIASAAIGSLGALLDILTRHSANGRFLIPEPTMLSAALSTVVICIGLVVTLRLHTRRQWRTRQLILPFTGLSLLWFALAVWIPVREFSLPGTEQEEVAQVFGANAEAIAFTSERVHYNQHTHQVFAGYNLVPNAPTHPDHWEIRWNANRTTWLRGGETIHRAPARRHQPTGSVITPDNPPASPAFMHILREHAPGFKLLVTNRAHEAQPRTTLEAGQLNYPNGETPRDPLTIESAITAAAARWTLAANLPFATGQAVDAGNWHLAGVYPRPGDLQAYLVHHTPKLHTFRNPSQPANRWGWTRNVLFALHVPERKMVWIADTNFTRWVPTLSSAAHTFSEIRFASHPSNTPDLTASEMQSARLLIFQAEHLGEVTKTFHSPEFTLKPRPPENNPVLAAYQRTHKPKSTPGAFALWLAQHKNLPTDLPDDQFRTHLGELFDLERRSRAYLNYPHSPGVNHLARFVPHHRDLFLESIHGMTSRTSAAQIVLRTLSQGATEEDKPAIIAALADTPVLIDTISNRGWIADARPAIIHLLETSPHDLECLRALVSLNDPALDELLLASYQESPSVSSYQALLTIPRLGGKLNEITTRRWSPGLLIMDRLVNPDLELALTQGRHDALAQLYDVLPYLDEHGNQTWRAAEIVATMVDLPADIQQHRHDEKKVLGWLQQHKPADFRFDPVLRRFVLTKSNSI